MGEKTREDHMEIGIFSSLYGLPYFRDPSLNFV